MKYKLLMACLLAQAALFSTQARAESNEYEITVWNCVDDYSSMRVCAYNQNDSEMDIDYTNGVASYGNSVTLTCVGTSGCHLKFAVNGEGCAFSDLYKDSVSYKNPTRIRVKDGGTASYSNLGQYEIESVAGCN